jgi:hypothetical protein
MFLAAKPASPELRTANQDRGICPKCLRGSSRAGRKESVCERFDANGTVPARHSLSNSAPARLREPAFGKFPQSFLPQIWANMALRLPMVMQIYAMLHIRNNPPLPPARMQSLDCEELAAG